MSHIVWARLQKASYTENQKSNRALERTEGYSVMRGGCLLNGWFSPLTRYGSILKVQLWDGMDLKYFLLCKENKNKLPFCVLKAYSYLHHALTLHLDRICSLTYLLLLHPKWKHLYIVNGLK